VVRRRALRECSRHPECGKVQEQKKERLTKELSFAIGQEHPKSDDEQCAEHRTD